MSTASYGYEAAAEQQGNQAAHAERDIVVDLALFYERNNLLLNPDVGWVPGNVFATIVEGLDEIAAASADLWLHGAAGERLTLQRAER
jgi:hypothetical protein